MSHHVNPGAVYWNPKLSAHAVVYEVRTATIRAILVYAHHRPVMRRVTWRNGVPKGYISR